MDVFADAVLLVRIALFAAIVPLLARLPIRRLEALVEPSRPRREVDPLRSERTIRLTNLVCRFGRPMIVSLCMTRGLTLYYFLRRAGIDVSLVFGVGTVHQDFAGHCWLTRRGEPYLEKTDPRLFFTPVYSFRRCEIQGSLDRCIGDEPG
jgi:hypothetical protein